MAEAEAIALTPIVRQWHQRAQTHSQTPFDETLIDFCEGWDKVRWAAGQEPIALAFRRAKDQPLPEVAGLFDADGLKLLTGWCRELQRLAGAEPFYLASRIAGSFLGVDHVTASRWLRHLCRHKVIREVSKGSQKAHQASRYQYLGDGL